ncbi:MAG: histidine phosphatase family protein [Myxococcota bacterium]|nr:histidine phosphatase family protein [Myxococcota bacterium]
MTFRGTIGAVELILIRHALPLRVETPDGSPADPPLGAEGREQAERLSRWLARERLDALYTSPLRRARETAAPLEAALGLRAVVEPRVAEFDKDAPVYVPLEELKRTDPERWRALIDSGFYLEGEVDRFRADVVAALDAVIDANPGRRVAVFCHGGVVNAWLSHLLGLERLFLFEPIYTGVSRFLAARSGERSLTSLNEAAHLR